MLVLATEWVPLPVSGEGVQVNLVSPEEKREFLKQLEASSPTGQALLWAQAIVGWKGFYNHLGQSIMCCPENVQACYLLDCRPFGYIAAKIRESIEAMGYGGKTN
jgi:hypothetical protein